MLRIKWNGGKPTADGTYEGDAGGHELFVIIGSERTTGKEHPWWSIGRYRDTNFDLYGASGGVQRAVSCIREECREINRSY